MAGRSGLDTQLRVPPSTWNAGARRFKGYEAEEIIGRHFSVFYPPEAIAAGLSGAAAGDRARGGSHRA
jgi:hypothetical protein